MLIDLHTHSYPHSDDSFMSVDELIEGSKSLGLDGICLTDHDAFWTDEQIRDLSSKHEFLVIPGCEINTEAGHVLVFGLSQYEFGMHKPEFLRASVDQVDGVMIAAHPYRRRFLEEPAERPGVREEMLERASGDGFFRMCRGIEALNGRGLAIQNQFSLELGGRLSTNMTAGSDAHKVEQIGTVATEFQRPVSCLEDLIRELREGRYQPVDLRQKAVPRTQ
ncbi:MAG: PHP domain-containing protein [Chloroflexi bacterium]|nr:PHP domain-containing protein [Chloroflexota bacterium]MCH8891885.1 PHP domain-containing protein [Chloroflexota bacterium]MCH9016609.1 PHP domain-containing protein [Chloroflexota bacterium]MCI0800758.1 PHP domain-containing protein [Chloroflexota bacterium]MCI0810312.1 PHP domain-containing protein [Chloroflexota bacterium]